MKARIVKSSGGEFWGGEVYGHWGVLGLFERVGWNRVTEKCYTQWGAKRELMKWKKEHCGEEFEL